MTLFNYFYFYFLFFYIYIFFYDKGLARRWFLSLLHITSQERKGNRRLRSNNSQRPSPAPGTFFFIIYLNFN
jgi:hypothetical protein